jgi:crotonobetaine/carnitine-CoA ligase
MCPDFCKPSPKPFTLCGPGLESNPVPSYLQVMDESPKTASEKHQERFLLEALAANPEAVSSEKRS